MYKYNYMLMGNMHSAKWMFFNIEWYCTFLYTNTFRMSQHCCSSHLTAASLDLIDPRTHPFVYQRLQAAMVSIGGCLSILHTHVHSTHTCGMHMYTMCVQTEFIHTLSLSSQCSQRLQEPTAKGSPCEYPDTIHMHVICTYTCTVIFNLHISGAVFSAQG